MARTSKLQTFRIIGESAAHGMGPRVKPAFFEELAKQFYPDNKHRRQWAYDNLAMFYNEECSRIRVWERISRIGS